MDQISGSGGCVNFAAFEGGNQRFCQYLDVRGGRQFPAVEHDCHNIRISAGDDPDDGSADEGGENAGVREAVEADFVATGKRQGRRASRGDDGFHLRSHDTAVSELDCGLGCVHRRPPENGGIFRRSTVTALALMRWTMRCEWRVPWSENTTTVDRPYR